MVYTTYKNGDLRMVYDCFAMFYPHGCNSMGINGDLMGISWNFWMVKKWHEKRTVWWVESHKNADDDWGWFIIGFYFP